MKIIVLGIILMLCGCAVEDRDKQEWKSREGLTVTHVTTPAWVPFDVYTVNGKKFLGNSNFLVPLGQ